MLKSMALLKCHLKHVVNAHNEFQVLVGSTAGGNRIDTILYAITAMASMYYCVNLPIGRKVDAVDLLQMTLQKHDTATSPQVPDTTKGIQTTAERGRKRERCKVNVKCK